MRILVQEEETTSKRSKRAQKWAGSFFGIIFMSMWLAGMTGGIAAGLCRHDRYEGETKLRFCNISLAATSWLNFSSIERSRGSINHLERGIALSQVGRDKDALDAFEQAIQDADIRDGHRLQELRIRMATSGEQHAQDLWNSVGNNAESFHFKLGMKCILHLYKGDIASVKCKEPGVSLEARGDGDSLYE